MDNPIRAVLFFENESAVPAHSRPLMLEPVLFCPILRWAGDQLRADGVQRFFLVCPERFAQEARACFPDDADVIISEQKRDLDAFLTTPDTVFVLSRAALPIADAGPGFAYRSSGYELLEAWKERMTNSITEAELVSGWLPVFNSSVIAEVEPIFRQRIVDHHLRQGVRILDPGAVYIDPRAVIGQGTMLLPGTMLEGECVIGEGCVIGPNARLRDCTVGDETEINASQLFSAQVGAHTQVGPFAYVRPGSRIGDHVKAGDFVEIKNSTIGDGTKISHLTYVGDSDVGRDVNFGCGTVTCNYDGFAKYRCTIGDRAFLGCNTNLIAPVTVGEGAYTAAGSTITGDVPADALSVARARQKDIPGWAARRRQLHGKD